MLGYIAFADRLSTFVGKLFAWTIVGLTGVVCYEVFMRYGAGRPTTWAYDVGYMLYGAGFIMAGAYALSRNAHVRADVFYRRWQPRNQARLDLVLYFLFFFPGMLAFVYSGWNFAEMSMRFNERSSFSPSGPVLWPFKMMIPLTGLILLIQGIAEVFRCVIAIRENRWPLRANDVEELEQQLAEQAAAGKVEIR
ncbi:MAG: TRAP transporter small permease subunit [Rubrimonas sp.]